jgi:alpha-D-xyloside xylohydrolase
VPSRVRRQAADKESGVWPPHSKTLLLASLLCACSSPQPTPSLRILAGDFSLAASNDGRSLALLRRHELLLRFPADAFELGTVSALDVTASYDPYWLEVGDDAFKPAPPKDLRFRKATGATVRKASDVELSLGLSFEGGLSATLTLKSAAEPWVFTKENGRDQETLDLYRKYARLHLRLFPYLWTYAKNLATDGRPLARPLGLAYPSIGVHPSDEYLLGDHLLVAPVMEEGARSRSVVLPPGEWVDFWDGTVLLGGGAAAQVAAPLDKLPLYLARGAIVPLLRPSIDTLSPTTAPDKVDSYATTPGALYARVVPSGSRTEFRLFDGSVITQDSTDPRSRLVLSVTAGETFRFGAVLEIAPMTEPQSLEVDGRVVPRSRGVVEMEREETSFAWLASMGGTLLVKVPPLSSEIRVDPGPKRR